VLNCRRIVAYGAICLIIHSQILSCYSFPVSCITFSCWTQRRWQVALKLCPLFQSRTLEDSKLDAAQIATSVMGLNYILEKDLLKIVAGTLVIFLSLSSSSAVVLISSSCNLVLNYLCICCRLISVLQGFHLHLLHSLLVKELYY
jgi:hypothetical protein